MTILTALIIFAIIAVIAIQLGKINDLAAKIRGEEEAFLENNNKTAKWLVIFMIVFLVGCVYSAWHYRNVMLGYGPWESASLHGKDLDSLFNVTLFFTGIVFVITHIALFWYAYKYRIQKGRKAKFFAHDTKLELIWTAIPAVVMAYLVANGLVVWNNVMPDINPGDQYLEIEATAYQFAWDIRYPGKDGKIGEKDFRLINLATNSLGIDFTDEASMDDAILSGSDVIKLPVDSLVRVRITAKDVLHNFYLPHFRVKMDAVPGLPTYFIFRPTKTTAQMRQELSVLPEWQVPYDPTDPEGPKRWQKFDYELACAELCGKGHYSMRRIVEVVTKEEYDAWALGLQSFYKTNIRGKEGDPNKDKLLLDFEINDRKQELDSKLNSLWGGKLAPRAATDTTAAASIEENELTLALKYVFFETGSARLNELSNYELDHISGLLKKFPYIRLEVGGHTDNVGDAAANKLLSQQRAASVRDRLVAQGVATSRLIPNGYGDSRPIDSNDTEEGKATNRRTELKVIR